MKAGDVVETQILGAGLKENGAGRAVVLQVEPDTLVVRYAEDHPIFPGARGVIRLPRKARS